MKRIFSRMLLLYAICSSCNKTGLDETQAAVDQTQISTSSKYLIRKGNHYADQGGLQIINTSSIFANVIFDSSAIYTTVAESNQADINKLFGFSDCGTAHHENSARLGWSWNGKEIILYAYTYVNKERIAKTLGPVQLNKPFDCFIKADIDYYHFTADKYTDSIPRFCNNYDGSRYKLFPYFGGDETAPHDISISVISDQ